jgi:hypothetical protein
MSVQYGTILCLTTEGRKLVDIPRSVTRWRIRERPAGIPMLFMRHASGRTEQWCLIPLGRKKMRPGWCIAVNGKPHKATAR